MPNTGRPSRGCHSCRQRRIKCDLIRPDCSQCLRKEQRCPGYRNEADTRFNIQTLYTFEEYQSRDQRKTYSQEDCSRVARNNEDSVVETSRSLEIRRSFQSSDKPPSTFTSPIIPLQIPLPSSIPFAPETTLTARWLSMVGPDIPGFETLTPLGHWTKQIPSRIGSNEALDSAAAYLLDASLTHFNPNGAHVRSMFVSGSKAAHSLRLAWAKADPNNLDDIINLMLTIQLNFGAEVFRRLEARVYFLHIRALSTLFKSCHLSFLHTELAQSIFSSTIYEEVIYSYVSGVDSTFDNPSFLLALTSGTMLWESPLAEATAFVSEHLILLPRALRLARSIRECHDPDMIREILVFIEKLYNDDSDQRIHGIIESAATIVPTRSLENATLVPQSYLFESTFIFKLFLRYFTFKILLYGIIEDLQQHFHYMKIDMGAMQVKDIQAAESIAMCVDQALNTYPAASLLLVRLILPLSWSFYAWNRLEARSQSSVPYERARKMQAWSMQWMNSIETRYRALQTPVKLLQVTAIALAGGPKTSRQNRITDPASIIAMAEDYVSLEDSEKIGKK